MDLTDFEFDPDPGQGPEPHPDLAPAKDLDLLGLLGGTWVGTGFNTIWRPHQLSSGQDRFLELNITDETLEFEAIPGQIPNRGLLQSDLKMAGLHYLQKIADHNVASPRNGLHVEPGVWLNIPATTNPAESASVARLASIPHGTTIIAQGIASKASGAPTIPSININPFPIGNPGAAAPFPEQNLQTITDFRTARLADHDITQPMVDNPNTVLEGLLHAPDIDSTITLQVSTTDLPVVGGGTLGTAFLVGGPAGPNAGVAQVTATFWIEQMRGDPPRFQLQYSQLVVLNFNNLSWPHVTVATLERQ